MRKQFHRLVLGCLLLATVAPAWAQMSNEQEINLGREAALKFEAKYGISPDVALQERLNRIGQSLVPHCGRTDIPYSFKVVNMKEFNALAFPGGFIYATSGLMQALDDQQLAFVIGHELTHVSHRHAVKQMSQDNLRQMGLLAALVALSGGRPSNAQAQVAGLVDRVIGSQYSQGDENDSDVTGIQVMAAAGYDPVHAISALGVLGQQAGGTPGFLNTFIGSHPMPADRLRDAVAFVPKVPYKPTLNLSSPPTNPPSGTATASPVPAGGQLNNEWTSVLQRDLALTDLNITHDPSISSRLAAALQRGQKPAPNRSLTQLVPSNITLGAFEAEFANRLLPRVQGKRLGLVVWQRADGSRQVVLLWP